MFGTKHKAKRLLKKARRRLSNAPEPQWTHKLLAECMAQFIRNAKGEEFNGSADIAQKAVHWTAQAVERDDYIPEWLMTNAGVNFLVAHLREVDTHHVWRTQREMKERGLPDEAFFHELLSSAPNPRRMAAALTLACIIAEGLRELGHWDEVAGHILYEANRIRELMEHYPHLDAEEAQTLYRSTKPREEQVYADGLFDRVFGEALQ